MPMILPSYSASPRSRNMRPRSCSFHTVRSHGVALVLADQHAVTALTNRAFLDRGVFVEGVGSITRAASKVSGTRSEAGISSRADQVFQGAYGHGRPAVLQVAPGAQLSTATW